MSDKMNKTSICSIVCLDIIDFSKKSDAEQIEIRNQFNSLIDHAVIDIAQSDRTILDTEEGAVIACTGSMEDALEDALFISLTLRDEILENNSRGLSPLYVRVGINLGSVRVAVGNKGQAKITGEGVDEAQRIMSFAKPNQILVSRPYYEIASKLSQEISEMFEYNDMHAHEHDVYSVRRLKDKVETEGSASDSIDNSSLGIRQLIASKMSWKYAVLVFSVLAAFFVLVKQVSTHTEPTITLQKPAAAETPQAHLTTLTAKPANEGLLPNETVQKLPLQADSNKVKVVQKKDKQKAEPQAKVETPASAAVKPETSKTEKSTTKTESSWQSFKDSFKHGSKSKCTQAEISMNQCQ
jgi:hypothetical protein